MRRPMHPMPAIEVSGRRASRAFRLGHSALAFAICLTATVAATADSAPGSRLRVYAYTLKHQQAHEVLSQVRPLLSARGTVEVQPGGNTLVIRETQPVIDRIARLLEQFDHPPQELRFDIQIVRAGRKLSGISPPQVAAEPVAELPEQLAAQLREYLRFDDYRVLAEAGVKTLEGEDVTYSLGQTYKVSFRSGTVMAGQRVKLEGFKILKQVKSPSNKGRQLAPRELFHATLNLWLDRPFNLLVAQDESRQEALMVVISFSRDRTEP